MKILPVVVPDEDPAFADGGAAPDEDPAVVDGGAAPDEDPAFVDGGASPDEDPAFVVGAAAPTEDPAFVAGAAIGDGGGVNAEDIPVADRVSLSHNCYVQHGLPLTARSREKCFKFVFTFVILHCLENALQLYSRVILNRITLLLVLVIQKMVSTL